jgi:hypothetical protein
MKKWGVLISIILWIMAAGPGLLPLHAATATNTPTATWNNATRQAYATIPFAYMCDPFNPCGALPWPVPRFPTINLPSPTLMEIYAEPATPTGTYVPSATVTPTPVIDTGPISTFSSQIGSLGGTLSVQSTAVLNVNGTLVGVNEIGAGLAAQVGAPFGLIKAVQTSLNSLGILGTIINFAFYSLLFILFIYLITAVLPFLLGIIRFVLQVISSVKP